RVPEHVIPVRMCREARHDRRGQVLRETDQFVLLQPRVDEQHPGVALYDDRVALQEFAHVDAYPVGDLLEHQPASWMAYRCIVTPCLNDRCSSRSNSIGLSESSNSGRPKPRIAGWVKSSSSSSRPARSSCVARVAPPTPRVPSVLSLRAASWSMASSP